MKIKSKRSFGEKHRLRREQHLRRHEKVIEDNQKFLEESGQRHREFLARQDWYQRIQALRPGDPCEFYRQSEWHAAVFVQHVPESNVWRKCWKVRDPQGTRLRVRHVRQPGDQEAFPGLQDPEVQQRHLERKRRMARLGVAAVEEEDVVEDVDPKDLEDAARAVSDANNDR